eukprot:CAMPEP_0183727440 /NCGR_PEP_ID=MMETSP0737-20130205/25705_1 /TAXON_ID=385413 /ORGANISM="Thalassiosira miniscula, Strain CCMP1093" /LENGTH=585 /DNA_ID=CAMNT_0025959089 /DNA_START=93 /DNA_END=1850 /DNA_ORIENTATION=-
MRFATSIRSLGRSFVNGTKKNGPSTSTLRNFGSLPQSAQQSQWSNNTLPTGALVASVVLASSITRNDNDQSQSVKCSALPTEPEASPATADNIAYAKPIKDINTIYKLGAILGEGGYGQVYYATRIKDGKGVALKCIPKEWTLRDEFQREVDVLQKLNNEEGGHPHICRMYEIYEGEKEYWMSMELIEGGELFEHLIEEGAYSEARAAVFMRQFIEALSFVHKAGVVHGDLKPENLLLSSWDNEEAEVKLVDFGCAIIADKCKEGEEPHGTFAYDPPEKLRNGSFPNFKSDVWAAGVILYIILTGSHPFDKFGSSSDEKLAKRVMNIGTNEERMSELAFDERTCELSPSARNLLRYMLHPDPEKRLTSEQIQRNRWVQGLTASWDILDGIDGKLEGYWQKEFQNRIFKKFGGAVTDEALRSVFKQIDEDGNGNIELNELTKVLKDSGVKSRDIRRIFDAINLDDDTGISFDEFKSVMKNELPTQFFQTKFRNIVAKELQDENKKKRAEPLKAAARRMFNSMDLDHNGSLDCYELRVLLRKLGVDEKEISLLVASVDLDKDGTLTFDEFSKVMFGARYGFPEKTAI